MGFRIATNVQSIVAQRVLTNTREAQGRSFEKLSAGERIVRAGDDAAGLSISSKLKAQLRSLQQASRNANDGVSLVQVAEGGMAEIQNILIRLRELSMQAATDTVGDVERSFTDKEVRNLVEEAERIAMTTEFNGRKLLDGKTGKLEFQVDTNNHPELDRIVYDGDRVNSSVEYLGIDGLTVATKKDAQENLERIDKALISLNDSRASIGGMQSKLWATMNNLNNYYENLSAANSRIRDTDFANETANQTRLNILAMAGTSMLAQANANTELALKLLS